jgi:hypothetical protein
VHALIDLVVAERAVSGLHEGEQRFSITRRDSKEARDGDSRHHFFRVGRRRIRAVVWSRSVERLFGGAVWCRCLVSLFGSAFSRRRLKPLFGAAVWSRCLKPPFGVAVM